MPRSSTARRALKHRRRARSSMKARKRTTRRAKAARVTRRVGGFNADLLPAAGKRSALMTTEVEAEKQNADTIDVNDLVWVYMETKNKWYTATVDRIGPFDNQYTVSSCDTTKNPTSFDFINYDPKGDLERNKQEHLRIAMSKNPSADFKELPSNMEELRLQLLNLRTTNFKGNYEDVKNRVAHDQELRKQAVEDWYEKNITVKHYEHDDADRTYVGTIDPDKIKNFDAGYQLFKRLVSCRGVPSKVFLPWTGDTTLIEHTYRKKYIGETRELKGDLIVVNNPDGNVTRPDGNVTPDGNCTYNLNTRVFSYPVNNGEVETCIRNEPRKDFSFSVKFIDGRQLELRAKNEIDCRLWCETMQAN